MPLQAQIFFQNPVGDRLISIVTLHNEIMYYLIIIFSIVMVTFTSAVIEGNLFFPYYKTENLLLMNKYILLLHRSAHGAILELFWTIVPTIILILIAVPSFEMLYIHDSFNINDTLYTIKAIGHQWYWTYETPFSKAYDSYMLPLNELKPGDKRLLEVDNPLYMPTNQKIRLLVTGSDVIHSFSIPTLGLKVDACPGRLNQVVFFVFRNGKYYGQCSEICGVMHGFMPISVVALEMEKLKA